MGPDCIGSFAGKWQSWIRDWWQEGWLPSIGVSRAGVRKFYVIYNRNGTLGGPHHNADCEAVLQMQQALVSAYRQCDTHVVITTHSNGGVTFLWAWRDFIERALNGPAGGSMDQDRATTCTAKGRNLPNGVAPPLYVNGHLMQAAVGQGGVGGSVSDFFPIQPYDTVGKPYWEPRKANGDLRALVGIRFYYNHEDVMTYDLTNISPVGRQQVSRWLDGTYDNNYVGAAFWQARSGQPPFAAMHVCGEQEICGDMIPRIPPGEIWEVWGVSCSKGCPTIQDWYDSAQGPGLCLNPCHRNCWGPTAMTAIRIRDPAVYPDKFPFNFGNSNLLAMSARGAQDGWLDNRMRLDWRDLFDRQMQWCAQPGMNQEQEPYVMGQGPKFGPLIPGRNDGSGEVTF